MKVKPFNCRGSRWNEVCESSLGDKYVLIKRPATLALLKKARGMMVTGMDVLKSDLINGAKR